MLQTLKVPGILFSSPAILEYSTMLKDLLDRLFPSRLLRDEVAALKKRLYLDPCGCYSRHYLSDTVAKDLQHMAHGVIVLDLDGLKAINDTKGHLYGDEYIYAFVSGLQALIRSTDLVIRVGGDEFLLVLPGKDVHALDCILGRLQLSIPFSFGCAIKDAGADLHLAIKVADRAMYAQKEMRKEDAFGGNQLHVVEDAPRDN